MTSKIKVTHIVTMLEVGGAQKNTLYTVSHLKSDRYERQLLSGPGGLLDEEAHELSRQGIDVGSISYLARYVHPWVDLWATFQIWRELKRFKPDIVHTHSSKAGILGRLAAQLAGVPVIIHTFHGFGFHDWQRPWVKRIFIFAERWTARFADKLIFVSKSNQDTALKLRVGKPEQYKLIRSGVKKSARASQEQAEAIKIKLGIPQGSALVTTIGPFKPQKNLSDYLRLAKAVTDLEPRCKLLLVGDGMERPYLEQLRSSLKLDDKVMMPGWRTDVTDILSASDVFVMTSLWEGLPRSLLEAMNFGIPPVCYNTDGIKDIVKNEENGFLFRPGEIVPMAERIVSLLRNSSLREKIGRAAASSIGNEFDIDVMVKQQEELYETLYKSKIQNKKTNENSPS